MFDDVARMSGVGRTGRLFRVTLPAALPSIATGIRVSAAVALLVCVTAAFQTGAGGVGAYMEDQQFAGRLPGAVRGRGAREPIRLRRQRRAPSSAAAYTLLGGRGAGSAVTTSVVRRPGGPTLGVLGFLAALGLWQLWAGAADSFVVPTAYEVAQAAWDVWPTSDFLGQVGQSMKRYAAGFAIAATIGIALGLLVGASRAARRTLDPLLECLRAVPAIAIVPATILIFELEMRPASR